MINLEKMKWEVSAPAPLLRRPAPAPLFHTLNFSETWLTKIAALYIIKEKDFKPYDSF